MKKINAVRGALTLAVLFSIGMIAGCGNGKYKSTFYPGTTLNGIDISEKSIEDVQSLLEQTASDYSLDVVFRNGDLQIASADISMSVAQSLDVQALKDAQNEVKVDDASEEDLALQVDQLFDYDQDSLDSLVTDSEYLDPEQMIAPEEAAIAYNSSENIFELVDGDKGTTLDADKVLAAVEAAAGAGETVLDLDAEGIYEISDFDSSSPEAQLALEEADKYLGIELTYTFSDAVTETVGPELIGSWIYVDENGNADIDQSLVQNTVDQFVEDHSADKTGVSFTTHDGDVISVKASTGVTVDSNKLFEDIISCLEDKTTGEREVPYTDDSADVANNFGGNYVEVDLTNQKLYLYKNKECIKESDVVSGCVLTTRMTPTGVFKIYNMEKNTTLKGADYESPVSFWMPFNGGYGLHDASWRSSFGGNIYLNNGSHGCVNLPYDTAKTLYENISIGYYVVIYGGVTHVDGQYVPSVSSKSSSSSSSSSSKKATETTEKKTETKATETTKVKETKKAAETKATEKKTETKAPETAAPQTSAPETSAPSGGSDSGSSDSGSGSGSSDSGSSDSGSGSGSDSGSSDSGSGSGSSDSGSGSGSSDSGSDSGSEEGGSDAE